MAVSSSINASHLAGNLQFSDGGMSVEYLIGSFVKSVASSDGVWTLTFQNDSGVEKTAALPSGWVVAAAAPSGPYTGQGWYDTTAGVLKIYDGSAFASLTALATALADDSVTPVKLDADNKTKKDAFLTRLNALRRDLNNIAALTIAQQRTALIALGSLINGPRPRPSADYAGRTWIDDHNDRAYICRNRQEVSTFVGGLWADANTTSVGIEIAENVGDLDDPANPVATDFAYTYADNKWWRGELINSQNVWRETQPTTALSARLTLKPNWTAVWVGKHRWDFNASQQLPHSGLPAMTDYYFYNTRTVTVRKLELDDYVAAGTPSDHWQWEPLIATAAEIDIIEARDGNLPALANDGTDDRQIAIANDGIHFVQLIPEAATAATVGAWATYLYAKTNPYRRYIGAIAEDPPSGTVGDFYYSTTRRRWRIYRSAGAWAWFNDHWEDLSDEDTAWPVRYVGNHGSRAEAIAYAASSGIKTGQTFVAFTGSEVETASRFNAGASARFSRHWRFMPLNRPTQASQLFLDDVFSMPGGPSESVDIETGNTGRNYKTVYALDHTVRISKVKVAASSQHAQGPENFRLTLLKGTAPNPDENTIHVTDVLWPVNIEQRERDEFTAALLLPPTPHTFDIPEVIVKRGEYLVVQLARVSTLSSRSRARVVRDLTAHHTFEAIRYVGSGTDDLDSGVAANYGIDNVEWADAGLWIEIEYEIEYDLGAAISTNTNDYLTALAFSVESGVVKAKATRHQGGEVKATGTELLAAKADLGVEVVYHATRASYTAASATDGKLHIVTVV